MTKNNNIEVRTKPFLRWAEGKNWITKLIETYLPENFENYFEPFLGGGSIYIYLKSKRLIKNKSIFSWKNQLELSNITRAFSESDMQFLLTNAFRNSIQELYKFNHFPISRSITIDNKVAKRLQYKEILITNIIK